MYFHHADSLTSKTAALIGGHGDAGWQRKMLSLRADDEEEHECVQALGGLRTCGRERWRRVQRRMFAFIYMCCKLSRACICRQVRCTRQFVVYVSVYVHVCTRVFVFFCLSVRVCVSAWAFVCSNQRACSLVCLCVCVLATEPLSTSTLILENLQTHEKLYS